MSCIRGFAIKDPNLSFKSLLRILKYPNWTSSYIVDYAGLGAVAQRGWRGGRLVGGEGDASLLFQRVLLHLQRVDGSSPLTETSCDFGLFKIYNVKMKNIYHTASLSAVLRSWKCTKLLHISETCMCDRSHYNWYLRLFTCAPVHYHIKLRDL